MSIPNDVHVYRAGYSNQLYRDMSQWLACQKSIEMLEVQMQTETEYGDGYLAFLQDRLNSARTKMAVLEAKYADWVDPNSN